MPNGKTDTNNNCAVSTDYIGQNYDYPEASYAEREKIIADHVSYQKGLMWTLANHPRVPREDPRRRWRSGAWRRTSSPTTATGRTSSTSARPGGWSATTS